LQTHSLTITHHPCSTFSSVCTCARTVTTHTLNCCISPTLRSIVPSWFHFRPKLPNVVTSWLYAHVPQAKEPALDIQYYIFERRLQIYEADAASTTSSVLARIKLEGLRSEVDRLMVQCYRRQGDFWTELTKLRPSLPALTSVGSEVEASLAKCEELFQKMLALSPHSVAVLRTYGIFLSELCNNPLKAAQYQRQADDYATHTGEEMDRLIGNEVVMYQPVRSLFVIVLVVLKCGFLLICRRFCFRRVFSMRSLMQLAKM
jgi:hypothetical protein